MTNPDPFEALYNELEATGQWYGITPVGPDGEGRVIVQRVTCGDYVQDAEIMRTFDGRGWVIYAACQCPTCLSEVRVAARLPGIEVDLVAAVNQVTLRLGDPESAADQHTPDCAQGIAEAEVYAEWDAEEDDR